MKTRIGFVSNSSSSSFVILKDSLSDKQVDMIVNCEEWIKFFIEIDDTLKDRFEYYDSDPWRIIEGDEYIFGETGMDNFDFHGYLEHIKINKKYIKWDDGYNDEPYSSQLDFIKKMKKQYRKDKLDKLNKK